MWQFGQHFLLHRVWLLLLVSVLWHWLNGGQVSGIYHRTVQTTVPIFRWLAFFKNQTIAHTLIPSADEIYVITPFLISAVIMKAVQVVHMIYTQVIVDMFFIDWEQPRAMKGKMVVIGDSNSNDKDSLLSDSFKTILQRVPTERRHQEWPLRLIIRRR